MTSNRLRLTTTLFVAPILLIAFQNCGKNLEVAEHPESDLFKRAEECIHSTSPAGACLFNKNPVSQAGKAVAADYVGGYQSHAVTLTDVSGGYLENAHLQVVTGKTNRLSSSLGFRHYYNPASSYLEQVSAYYFANELRRWLTDHGGSAHSGQGFKLVADSSFSAFLPASKELHFERNGMNLPAALDGSVVLHLYGQAYVWAATAGQSHDNVAASAQACTDARGYTASLGCCKTGDGCASAAVSGAGDYLAAVYFGSGSTKIGEGWKNDIAGLRTCGLTRDPGQQADLTRAQAHQACSSRGAVGNITAMGVLYASIWWEARKSASDQADFDKLFVRHLAEIRGDDTFATLKSKIIALDSSAFGLRHGAKLTAEFGRRGL